MPKIEMSIDGVNYSAEDELSVFPVRGFSWREELKHFYVTKDVNVLSAQIALLQVMAQTRRAVLRCLDDDNSEYLTFTLTDTKIHDFAISAGDELASEQFTVECAEVDMTTGTNQVSIQ